MAKVYDAENRGDLTTSQLDLAKEFDPVDPTPWLYSSLQKLRDQSARRGVAGSARGRAQERRPADLPLVAPARRGHRDAQRRTRPRAQRARLRTARVARRVARDRRRPDELRRSPVARGWLLDRAAARDRARQRAAGLAVAAACQRHADQAAARAAESVHRAARGPEPHVVRRARVARRSRTASSSALRPSAGGQRHRGRRRHLGGACTIACRTASATTGSRPTVFATTTISSKASRTRSFSIGPSHDTNLQAELRSARMEHGDLTTFFDRESLLRLCCAATRTPTRCGSAPSTNSRRITRCSVR